MQCTLKWDSIDKNVWSFDQPDLLKVHQELKNLHGTIGQHSELQISVGLQTLYGKLYQFEPVEAKQRTIIGKNGEGEIITLEKAALRPLCRNRGFFPFRKDNADAWVIFPYDIIDGQATEIVWKDFKERFPKVGAYLEERKRKLLKAVDAEEGSNRWHLYRYPKNLVSQASPKVLFPSTIEDTIATVDKVGNIYQDNVRMSSISFNNASIDQLRALACLFNSTLFSALARLKAGLSDSGWRQFNRQYAELVPFPLAIINDADTVRTLSGLADAIGNLQTKSISSSSEGAKTGFRAAIESLWRQLDETVESIYKLTKVQKEVLKKYPRRVNRFDLLTRQTSAHEDEE